MTFDPMLVITPQIEDDILVSNVIRDDKVYASKTRSWLNDLRSIGSHTRNRSYIIFGTNSAGLNVLICRYLCPQRPPKGFETRRSCIHLVSIIPFMKDSQSFIGEMDLWCTNKQFWDIGAGDEEEHATMLYNYLYYISHKSGKLSVGKSSIGKRHTTKGYPTDEEIANESVFFATGKAIPEGRTNYVIIRDDRRQLRNKYSASNYLVINPCTGYVYSAADPNCPLKEINTLATPYNLWANIQINSEPSKLIFNLQNKQLWKPYFDSRIPIPEGGIHSVQGDCVYIETTNNDALEIEKSVHQSIRNGIRKWRSKRAR